jgi:hypothetical protein
MSKKAKQFGEAVRAAIQPKSLRTRMPTFEPTEQQRLFVAAMAGVRMTQGEIALLVLNPRTNKPIDAVTLRKAFAYELEAGVSELKSIIATRFIEKVKAGESWAVQYGLKAINKISDSAAALTVMAPSGNVDGGPVIGGLQIEFVTPKRRDDDELV